MSTWGFKGFLKRFLEAPDAAQYDDRSPAGRGRIRYNDASKAFEASVDGGPYLPFQTGSPTASDFEAVPDLAALSALDDSAFVDGNTAAVATLKDQFYLDKTSTEIPDGITVVATLSGTGRWIRRELPSMQWVEQDTWYIDPANGDDELDGNTVGTALQTWDELRRRFGQLPVRSIVIVNLLGNPGDIIADFNTQQEGTVITSAIVIDGANTVVATLPIATVTPHNNATRTFGNLDMGVDVSAHVNRLMLVSSGAAAGAHAYALASGVGGVNSLDTGPFLDMGLNETYPAGGDTIQFCDQTPIASIVVKPGAYIVVRNCTVAGRSLQEAGGTLVLNRCRVNLAVTFKACAYLSVVQGTYISQTAFIDGENTRIGNFTSWVKGRIRLTNGTEMLLGASTLCFHSTPGSGAAIALESSQILGSGALAYYRLSAVGAQGLRVRENSHVRLPVNFWGREIANTALLFAADVGAGSLVTYPAASPPDFAPNENIRVGGATLTISGDLPTANTTNFAGFVVEV